MTSPLRLDSTEIGDTDEYQEGGCPLSVDKLLEMGKEAGFKGDTLLAFVREQQSCDRERRARKRSLERQRQSCQAEHNKLQHERYMIEMKLQDRKLELELAMVNNQPSSGVGQIPKLPKFRSDRDNMDAYLLRFEKYAEAKGWSRERWSLNLGALLEGKALEVYVSLPAEHSNNYEKLKAALLARFNLDEDGYRMKFKTSRQRQDETFSQFYSRNSNNFDRWIEASGVEKDFDGLRDLVIREQCLFQSSPELVTFVREHTLVSSEQMLNIAECYERAHRRSYAKQNNKQRGRSDSKSHSQSQSLNSQQHIKQSQSSGTSQSSSQSQSHQGSSKPKTCHKCGKVGHFKWECKKNQDRVSANAAVCDSQIEGTDNVKGEQGQCPADNSSSESEDEVVE